MKNLISVLKYGILILASIFLIFPFFVMLSYALRNDQDISLLSYQITFHNFLQVFQLSEIGFFECFLNTVNMVFFSTLFGTLISIITAFAFNILDFKFKKTIFRLFLLGMMIIPETLLLSNFRTISNLKMVSIGQGTTLPFGVYFAMILPFLVDFFNIFLLMESAERIPKELYYTSKIDAASDFNYLLKIWIPILKPTIFTIIIFRSVAAWNAYLWPELVGGKLLTNTVTKIFSYELSLLKMNLQMAFAFLIILPLILIFLFFKKYIITGELNSGIKG